MTYPSSGPEQVKAPDVDPSSSSSSFDSSSSSSSTSSHSHSHSHSNSHARSNGKRHLHIHRYDQPDEVQPEDFDNARRNLESPSQLRHSQQHRAQFRDANTVPKLEAREDQTGYVTQVIQTVSLVQIVDSTGSPIEIQTRYGTPNTIIVDSASGNTISVSEPESSTAAAPASNSVQADYVVQSSGDMSPMQASTPGVDATSSGADSSQYAVPTPDFSNVVTTPVATTSQSIELDTLQDTALTPSHNATSSAISTESSTSVSSQTTLTDITSTTAASSKISSGTASKTSSDSMHIEMISSTQSSTLSSISSISSATTSLSTSDLSSSLSSTIYSYSTETWTSTQYNEGGDGDGGGGGDYSGVTATDTATIPTSTSSNSTSGTLTTQQKQVIGGVVGSIAGVAMLALLVLLALKYKKRQNDRALLGGSSAGTRTKGLITGGGGNGSSGAMAERSGPFAVAAVLAGLASKRGSQPPEPASERGFYRVSGKKLPSVLHNGGDGYTDPRNTQLEHSNRDSVASGHTDYWRGSQAFEPAADGSTRLALGTPMRPVSGVPIIRTGPARTPVKEDNPFADPVSRPRPDSDALGDSVAGGSIASQDGSWNSPSKFQERI